jgi:hypothetical protein
MATVMKMHWAGVTKDQYEAVRKEAKWETDVPEGAKYHVAWFSGDALQVMDIWKSGGDFQRFAETRLMPAVAKVGVKGQPNVEFFEAHATFAPNP